MRRRCDGQQAKPLFHREFNHDACHPQNRLRLKQWFNSRQIQYSDNFKPWRLRIEDPSAPPYDADIELVSRWALDWLIKVVS